MFEDNFMVLVNVLFYRQETEQHRDDGIADELHGQVANDERRFHSFGLGGELRIISVCGGEARSEFRFRAPKGRP